MVIYLAAPYVHKAEAKRARVAFREADITVNSRWLDFRAGSRPSRDTLRREASNDVEDIIKADVLVVLNTTLSEGKAWEQGLAYGLGIPIIGVGKPENCVFHHLEDYYWVPDVAAAIKAIKVSECLSEVARKAIVKSL